jgi:hypothetical protein
VRWAGNLAGKAQAGWAEGRVADMTAVFAVDACRTPVGKFDKKVLLARDAAGDLSIERVSS